MRVIFMGTPDFSVPALKALIASKHSVEAVFCQPDRKQGRGQKLQYGPVKEVALAHSINVHQPLSLKDTVYLDLFAKVDVVIVIAYGLILPQAYLEAPKYGCLNIHASLLPRWRGAAPIQRAIAAGDHETGVCLMQMEKGLDTGPVLNQKTCAIADDDTTLTLSAKLSKLAIEPLLDWFDNPNQIAKHQSTNNIVYAEKITPAEAKINWQSSAKDIFNLMRAFSPWPGLYFDYKGLRVKLHRISIISLDETINNSGQIIKFDKNDLLIQAKFGVLKIEVLQLANKQKLHWQDFYIGNKHFFELGAML